MAVCNVGDKVFIDGRDPEANPPLTLRVVRLWQGVPRRRGVGTLPHGTAVEIMETRYYTPESRWYYRVHSILGDGWLSEPFVSFAQHEPVGDWV